MPVVGAGLWLIGSRVCGIAGIVTKAATPRDVERIAAAAAALRHRGPDDEGYLWWPVGGAPAAFRGSRADRSLGLPTAEETAPFVRGPGVLLAHNRLSIIDLSSAGHQPMATADGRMWIAFNGEVYNYRELRAELEAEGLAFRTQTDTEVVLQAFARWGEGAAKRFIGMFAFALLDGRDPSAPRLWLARDPFGIKPLYHAAEAGELCFASEIKGLLAMGVAARPNMIRVLRYAANGETDMGAETMFAGVRQLPLASLASVALDAPANLVPRTYWKLNLGQTRRLSLNEAAEELRRLFLRSIVLHLRSDVPVGAALSGGVDSSSIVCAMREAAPEAEIHAFSYIADDPAKNEERWLDMAAAQAGARVHKTHPDALTLLATIERLMACQDEPFGSTSIHAQHEVFRLAARAGIKVMLDGQGADEMLAGYPTYEPAFVLSALVSRQFGRLLRLLRRRPLRGSRTTLVRRSFAHGRGRRGASKRESLAREWRNLPENPFAEAYPEPAEGSPAKRALAESLQWSSLPMLLRFEDRNSMAFSIESRVPFLTTELVEFVYSLPDEHLLGDDGFTKSVFRRAMSGLVPDAVLSRRDKIGFATPQRQWLSQLSPWAESLFAQGEELAPAMRPEVIQDDLSRLRAGRGDFGSRLWRRINLLAWARSRGFALGE